MEKIIVGKNDEIGAVIEKLVAADTDAVTVSIPRFSKLSQNPQAMKALKREGEALGKRIHIESLDERIRSLAEQEGLTVQHPFSQRQFSDIVSRSQPASKNPLKKTFLDKVREQEKAPVRSAPADDFESKIASLEVPPLNIQPRLSGLNARTWFSWLNPWKIVRALPWKTALVLVAFAGGAVFAAVQLPRAEITIVTQKSGWEYHDSIVTDKAATVNAATFTIPNQVFVQKKNAELKFPASGRKEVSRKATGRITVYNAYSSEPQALVANTRFVTPDGKIFRLADKLVVPGAKIQSGKIIPSSIETEVIADQPGPDYNVGPVNIFTIPGFKGSPKFDGFYGESKTAMAGGFIGETAYPTDGDITKAKTQLASTLQESILAELKIQVPKDFKVLDEAIQFTMLTQKVNDITDEQNQFSIFGEAQGTAIAFREEDVVAILRQKAAEEKGDAFEIIDTALSYGFARVDPKAGKMSFLVDFKANLRHKVDTAALTSQILGMPELELKSTVFALPGMERADVSLWPFWVKTVPKDSERIKIEVD